MILRYLTMVASAFAYAMPDGTPVHGQTGAENSTTPTLREGNRTIHFVTVGKAENNFYPNSIVAQPGDIVTFQFYPLNHSVIKAAYGYPCVPYEDIYYGAPTFTSGFMPVEKILPNPPTWNLTINDTEPVFYYCGAPGSCIDWGMVGVINANASTSISTQIALAREADYQLLPGEPFPNEKQQASMASLAATATTATLTVTATNARHSGFAFGNNGQGSASADQTSSSSGLSSGAIAGIAVGAAVVGIGLAALFFFMLRTRALKRKLDQQREQQQQTAQNPGPGPFSPMLGNFQDHSRHTSGLPPYQGVPYHQDAMKPQDLVSETVGTPRASPRPMQGHFYEAYQPPMSDPRFTQYTSTSELTGNAPPISELAGEQHDIGERTCR